MQNEFARIEAALHRNLVDQVGDLRRGDAINTDGRVLNGQANGIGDLGLEDPARRIDARIRIIIDEVKPLQHWTPVHVHLGATDVTGRVAILDATFGRCRRRAMAAELARELRVPIHIVEVRCSAQVAVARLARRERMGTDPSDAGPALYADSGARFEPVTGEGNLQVIHTDVADWRDAIHELARVIA